LDDLVQEVQIAASPETVWEELTKRDKPQRPQMDTVLESSLEPGAPLLYTSHDGSRVFVVGRVIEIDPPRRLSHTWRLTMRDDEPTLVTWELEPSGEGTRVRLTHTGWPEDARGLGRVDSTWRTILDELRNVVERGGAERQVAPDVRAAAPIRIRSAEEDQARERPARARGAAGPLEVGRPPRLGRIEPARRPITDGGRTPDTLDAWLRSGKSTSAA